jgi:hypothetical protein
MAQRQIHLATDKHLTRLILSILAILVATAITVAALLAWLTINDPFGGKPHPTDAEMLAHFQQQRAALDAQVLSIKQDAKLERVAPDFTRPEDLNAAGVTPERIAEYRSRLRAAGLTHGFSHYGNAIEFIVSTRGLAISGSAKSFVFAEAPDPDATIVNGDLDAAFAASPEKSVLLRRQIDGNWWLQLDTR